jgi:hypothetical protein
MPPSRSTEAIADYLHELTGVLRSGRVVRAL